MLARSIVGSPDVILQGVDALVAETGADELMIVSDIYHHGARLRSFELIAAAGGQRESENLPGGSQRTQR